MSEIDILKISSKPSLMKIKTNGHEVLWQPDPGATCDIWDEKQLKEYEKLAKVLVTLKLNNIKLYGYRSKTTLSVIGKFGSVLEAGMMMTTSIYVTKEPSVYPLL